jgi:hypothetical protein
MGLQKIHDMKTLWSPAVVMSLARGKQSWWLPVKMKDLAN